MIDDKDKLRILWDCHNKQLDENRAVGRALDDLRWRINEVCNHLSIEEERTKPEPKYKECKVEGCKQVHHGKGFCAMHYWRNKNNGDPHTVQRKGATMYQYASLEDYFDRNTKKESNGCLMWLGATDPKGYGSVGTTRWGKEYNICGAHRLSYFYYKGEIAEGMHVCHKCDNPSCVNPDHLFLGTHADNMKDMSLKGRKIGAKGEKGSRAKLTKDQAIYILQSMESKTVHELANEFDVCIQTIRNIWHGVTKYIEPEIIEEILPKPDIQRNQSQLDVDRCHKCNVLLASNGQCGNLDCVDRCQHEIKFEIPKCDGFNHYYLNKKRLCCAEECQHEYTPHLPCSAGFGSYTAICSKCGEFYR